MKRRDFFKTVGLSTAGLALSQFQFCQRTMRKKPNLSIQVPDETLAEYKGKFLSPIMSIAGI